MTDETYAHRTSAQKSLERAIRLADESTEVGINTLRTMDAQGEQMQRISNDAQDTEVVLKHNRKVVKDMRRNWCIRLCCYGRDDTLPSGATYRTPEETARAKKMVKAEKMARKKSRKIAKAKAAEKAAAEGGAPVPVPVPAWKFWKSKKPVVDSDSEDSGDEETNDSPPVLPKSTSRLGFRSKTAASPEVPAMSAMDEDTGLDVLSHKVAGLKTIAGEMGLKAVEQTEYLKGIDKQVAINQASLEKNQQLAGKLRQAKPEQKEFLSVTDKLALQGLKSSVESKFTGGQ